MSETIYDFLKNNLAGVKILFPESIIQNATIKDCDEITTSFIRDEFERIGKESAWEFNDLKENPILKTYHSLILYYLGMATKKTFIKNFDVIIKKIPDITIPNTQTKQGYWFEYIWCLTSFYHDVMTKYEKDERKITSEYMPYVLCPMMTIENFLNS